MGLIFTLIYVLYMYISPSAWIPWLATIRVQPFVAGLACVWTLPRLLDHRPFKASPQLLLFLAFSAYLAMSPALQGWFGGAVAAVPGVAVPALLLFLIPVNCDTVLRRQILVAALIISMMGLVLPGIYDYYHPSDQSKFLLRPGIDEEADSTEIQAPPALDRLKAQGLIDDPNDFAQLLLVTTSLCFFWWGRNWLKNVFLVLLPAAILLYGVYLTHSRGALVALAVMVAVAFRRKLRWLGSLVVAGVVALGLLTNRFTGGREISLSAAGGGDRLDIWSDGLQLLKSSPLLGRGYGGFSDAVEMTAHNSFLLVAVELGLPGLVLWVAIFVICFYQIQRIVVSADGAAPDPVLSQQAVCLEVALTAFLATSWFLSRAYQPASFLLVGLLGGLVYQETLRRPGAVLMLPWRTCLIRSLAVSAAAVLVIYAVIRLRAI